jgi:hypothetical protein
MGELTFQRKNLEFIFKNKFDPSILQKWETIKSKYLKNPDTGYDIFLSMLDARYVDSIWSEIPTKSLAEFKSFLQTKETNPEALKQFYHYISVEGNIWLDIQASTDIRKYLKEIFGKVSSLGRQKEDQNFQLFTYFLFGNRFFRPNEFDEDIAHSFSNGDFSNALLGKILKQNFHQLHANWKKKNFMELQILSGIFNFQLDVGSNDDLYFEKFYLRYNPNEIHTLAKGKVTVNVADKKKIATFIENRFEVNLGEVLFTSKESLPLTLELEGFLNYEDLSFVIFVENRKDVNIYRYEKEQSVYELELELYDKISIPLHIKYQSIYINVDQEIPEVIVTSENAESKIEIWIPIEYSKVIRTRISVSHTADYLPRKYANQMRILEKNEIKDFTAEIDDMGVKISFEFNRNFLKSIITNSKYFLSLTIYFMGKNLPIGAVLVLPKSPIDVSLIKKTYAGSTSAYLFVEENQRPFHLEIEKGGKKIFAATVQGRYLLDDRDNLKIFIDGKHTFSIDSDRYVTAEKQKKELEDSQREKDENQRWGPFLFLLFSIIDLPKFILLSNKIIGWSQNPSDRKGWAIIYFLFTPVTTLLLTISIVLISKSKARFSYSIVVFHFIYSYTIILKVLFNEGAIFQNNTSFLLAFILILLPSLALDIGNQYLIKNRTMTFFLFFGILIIGMLTLWALFPSAFRSSTNNKFTSIKKSMNWEDATEECKRKGFRLPTISEFGQFYQTDEMRDLVEEEQSTFWTSSISEDGDSLYFVFSTGESGIGNLRGHSGVVCFTSATYYDNVGTWSKYLGSNTYADAKKKCNSLSMHLPTREEWHSYISSNSEFHFERNRNLSSYWVANDKRIQEEENLKYSVNVSINLRSRDLKSHYSNEEFADTVCKK